MDHVIKGHFNKRIIKGQFPFYDSHFPFIPLENKLSFSCYSFVDPRVKKVGATTRPCHIQSCVIMRCVKSLPCILIWKEIKTIKIKFN